MKHLRIFKILFIGFSLSSCATFRPQGPILEVCVSEPSEHGLLCADHESNKKFLPYELSQDYVALPADDFQALLNYCKVSGK